MGQQHINDVKELIDKYHISSVLVKQCTPQQQIEILEELGRNLFVFRDAEWGLGMTMEETISFPRNGYLKNEELIYKIGKEIARELRCVGCHVNLAPVCDVNSNPKNTIIKLRSFGSDACDVARKVVLMTKGLQDGGVLACGKHFPGHGDVEIDSHIALPVVQKDKEGLKNLELIPFQAVIDVGIGAIMTGHLHMAKLKEHPIDILRDEMGFLGVVISDAMNMKAVVHTPEDAALIYLKAGHDLLLYGSHTKQNVDKIIHEMVPKAYQAVLESVKKGELNIEDKIKRIEEAKLKWKKPRMDGEVNTEEAFLLKDLFLQDI